MTRAEAAKQYAVDVREIVEYTRTHNGPRLSKAWLVQAVMQKHQDIHGADSEWYAAGAEDKVKDEVEQYFRMRQKAEEAGIGSKQMCFGWAKHLQEEYLIQMPDGDTAIIPTAQCTDAQLEWKADWMIKTAKSLREHAAEIRRYIRERSKTKKKAS